VLVCELFSSAKANTHIIYTYSYTQAHTHTCTHTHAHTHMHTRKHTQTHPNTHTGPGASPGAHAAADSLFLVAPLLSSPHAAVASRPGLQAIPTPRPAFLQVSKLGLHKSLPAVRVALVWRAKANSRAVLANL